MLRKWVYAQRVNLQGEGVGGCEGVQCGGVVQGNGVEVCT